MNTENGTLTQQELTPEQQLQMQIDYRDKLLREAAYEIKQLNERNSTQQIRLNMFDDMMLLLRSNSGYNDRSMVSSGSRHVTRQIEDFLDEMSKNKQGEDLTAKSSLSEIPKQNY